MKTLFTLCCFLIIAGSINASHASQNLIYGDDNRVELYQASAQWQQIADSTVAVIDSDKIKDAGNGLVRIISLNAAQEFHLCSNERFALQPAGSPCSGVLVTPNVVLTAGHCVTANTCDGTKMLFGYSYSQPNQNMNFFSATEVYTCKSIISRAMEPNGADYALMQLDRSVVGHKPAALSSKVVSKNEAVVVIGHPLFLPTKIAGGANVRKVSDTFFVANTDTYGGNSGSPVYNEKTGAVEGILVRGDSDFVKTKDGCFVSNVCSNSGCRGEDITRIDVITPHIPH